MSEDKHRPGYHAEYYKKYKERMKNDPLFAMSKRAKKLDYWNKRKKDKEFVRKHNESSRKSFKKRQSQPNYISCFQKNKLKVYELLGGAKCKNCGFDDTRALQVDHIFNNGNNELYILSGTYGIYKKIISMGEEAKTEYQILCANCNWIRRKPQHCISNGRKIKCIENWHADL
jgi:hypothetical protein